MASPESVPKDVVRFIDANVETIEQLEILRVLGESPEREWSVDALAKAAQLRGDDVTAQLTVMQNRGLLRLYTVESELTCAFGPHDPQTRDMLKKLFQLYKERPVTMIKLVYARAQNRLNAFSDAFRLRKQEE